MADKAVASLTPNEINRKGQAPLLQVRSLSIAFGGVQALNDLDLEVESGTISSIIGPNGAGKTTFFNLVSGFYQPTQGEILFGGQPITSLPGHKRGSLGIARTFQNIALFRGMSVLDNIKLGAHSHLKTGLFGAGIYFRLAQQEELQLRETIEREIIDFLEIDHIRNAPVSGLPYGLQKRVELARALAMRPRMLLLDEPVAGMNREETEDMARFILDIQEQWGTTILLVDHDMGMVMDISDQVFVLNFGELIAAGKPETVQSNPAVVEAYLGQEKSRIGHQAETA